MREFSALNKCYNLAHVKCSRNTGWEGLGEADQTKMAQNWVILERLGPLYLNFGAKIGLKWAKMAHFGSFMALRGQV